MIKDNLNLVRDRIKTAARKAGRSAEDIVLVSVVKEADIADIREVIKNGVMDLGENTIQAAATKYKALGSAGIKWHFIGHLQRNKAKDAVRMFDVIHSVDSIRLAEAIQKEAERAAKTQEILLQVNVSGEESKYGLRPEDAKDALSAIRGMQNIKVSGLMTIAPYSSNPEDSRKCFEGLRVLRDTLGLTHLSMGMSGDFEVAIEEGADIVRIGSAIFR